MKTLGEFGRRIGFLFRRQRFQREIDEELRFHLGMRAERNRMDGMEPEAAEFAARRRLGNTLLLRQRSHEAWGWCTLERFAQDVKFSVRSLNRTPVFTSIVVLTLAFGIGVNTAVFSAVRALLLQPYPFPHADDIVSVEARHVSGKNSGTGYMDFLDWRQQNSTFEAMAILPETGEYTLTGLGTPQRIIGGVTTADFWRVLEVRPAIGRFLTKEDEARGAAPVAVLTYAAWRQRFGANPAVLGSTMELDGRAITIIGVLPSGFAFPGIETCEFFAPLRASTSARRTQHQYGVVARLKSGVSVSQAQSDMSTIARRLELQYPATNTGWGVKVQTLSAALAHDARTPLLVLFAAVGCVLLLACMNIAGLLLARASRRSKEVAIRASLGANRARIVRQMLMETMLLGLAGGGAGVLLAFWLMEVLRRKAPQEFALDSTLKLDPAMLLFTFAVSLLTGILAGLIPAWITSGTEPNAILKSEGNAFSGARSQGRALSVLIAGEVALSVILMAGAGLLVKSFVGLLHVETGIRAEHVLTFALDLPSTKYSSPAQVIGFYRDVIAQLRNSAGVESAAAVMTLPMNGGMTGGAFEVEGRPKASDWVDTLVQYNAVTDEYFRTMGIPLLRGRDFDPNDTSNSSAVAIVNDTLARQYFPGQNPIGHRYRDVYSGQWRTIVGVVGSVKHQQPMKPPFPGVYAPATQWASNWMWVTVRSRGDAAEITTTARAVVQKLDGDLPLIKIRSMRGVVSDSVPIPRLLMQLLVGFAVFALLLDAIGIYGIVDYSVQRRTREVGIRMALGATRSSVIGLLLRMGTTPVAIGAAVGIPLALVATRVLRRVLFGISLHDGGVFMCVPAILVLVALAASLPPARRASKLDTVAALRSE